MIKKWGLDSHVAEKETEAHVELRSLKVNVLQPDRGCLHMLANTVYGTLENLFDLLVSVRAQQRVVILQEAQVALPQIDLGGVVAQ